MDFYYNKYIKYKLKYFDLLKNDQNGGGTEQSKHVESPDYRRGKQPSRPQVHSRAQGLLGPTPRSVPSIEKKIIIYQLEYHQKIK
jgi:hypothetical protein